MKIKFEIIQGSEGPCLSLNDYRIAGPKPWGGAGRLATFDSTIDELNRALVELGFQIWPIAAVPARKEGEGEA